MASPVRLSKHAAERCAQRCVRPADLELAMMIGTHIDDGVLVRQDDARRFVAYLRQLIASTERLRGVFVAYPDAAVVTVYRPSRRGERRIMRGKPHANSNARIA